MQLLLVSVSGPDRETQLCRQSLLSLEVEHSRIVRLPGVGISLPQDTLSLVWEKNHIEPTGSLEVPIFLLSHIFADYPSPSACGKSFQCAQLDKTTSVSQMFEMFASQSVSPRKSGATSIHPTRSPTFSQVPRAPSHTVPAIDIPRPPSE